MLPTHSPLCLACQFINRDMRGLINPCTSVSAMMSASRSGVLLRCKKWRCDKLSSGDVACKHQSFGRCAVSKLAVYSPWPSHTPLSGLRLIVCRLPYEEQLIYSESNCKRTEWGVEEVDEIERWRRKLQWLMREDEVLEVCVLWYIFTLIRTQWQINVVFRFAFRINLKIWSCFYVGKTFYQRLKKRRIKEAARTEN